MQLYWKKFPWAFTINFPYSRGQFQNFKIATHNFTQFRTKWKSDYFEKSTTYFFFAYFLLGLNK